MSGGFSIVHALQYRLREDLRALMEGDRPWAVRSAPAKVDVLGALAVDAGGTLAQMALPRRVAVALQRRGDASLVVHNDEVLPPIGEGLAEFPLTDFFENGAVAGGATIAGLAVGERGWAWPVVAAWWSLLMAGRVPEPQGGATVVIRSDVPTGAEQGSSVALIAAVIESFCAATGVRIEAQEKALYIQRAEGLLGPGHLVDALAVLQAPEGAEHRLLWLSAQPHELMGVVKVPGDLRVMALELGVHARGAAGTVRELRLAGAMGLRIIETIYRDLGQRHTPLRGYLANLSPSLYRQYFRNLLPRRMRGADYIRTYGAVPERSGKIEGERIYRVRTAVDHLISENEYAGSFLQAVEELADEGHVLAGHERELVRRRAGRLLLASHHSYRLRLGLSVREADWLVELLSQYGPGRGVYGARISGCGGGGTVVALLGRTAEADDALLDAMNAYSRAAGLRLVVTEAGGSGSGGVLNGA